MRVALVYDRVNKIGGAERVLESLHQLWPNAPLFTSVYEPTLAPWAKSFTIIPSFVNKIPFLRRHHEWLPMLMPYVFESFDFSEFDVVISITSAEAKGILTGTNQLHICYLLTPTRYLWSHTTQYAGDGVIGYIRRLFMHNLQRWDLVASSRPDKMIAISQYVAARCQTYYHRESNAIIYPPVNTRKFSTRDQGLRTKDYFLVVSRLVPYKQVDLAIKACNQLKLPLKIVGTGSEQKKLQRLAGPTISFLGQVNDDQLPELYRGARALLFPQEEEFGITAIEAQASGIPVIAYNQGAAAEIIKPGITGILFEAQTVQSLIKAISHLNHHTWYDKNIQEHARQFNNQVFQLKFKQFVETAWQNLHQSE